MQYLKCCVIISLLTILVMDAAAAPASSSKPSSSARLPPLRVNTNHSASNNEGDEFWGYPEDDLANRFGSDDQQFEDDGNGLMEHNVLTENGDIKNLEVIGSENFDIPSRFGEPNDGRDSVIFKEDFAPENEPIDDKFEEPHMLLSRGQKINEDLKGPGYDWSVMGKVRRTTEKPQINILFAAEEESDPKPWETDSRPGPNSSS